MGASRRPSEQDRASFMERNAAASATAHVLSAIEAVAFGQLRAARQARSVRAGCNGGGARVCAQQARACGRGGATALRNRPSECARRLAH